MYASDKYVYGAVGERLHEQMKEHDLTQCALSKETGISQSQISKILHGQWEFLTDGFWIKLKRCNKINFGYVKYGI